MSKNKQVKVALLGVPFDDNSSFEKGPALAPDTIRKVLNHGSLNGSTELGVNLRESEKLRDAGDIEISLNDNFIDEIERRCDQLLASDNRILT
jgi:arginase family enzyme